MTERLTKKDYARWLQVNGYYNKEMVEELNEKEHKLGKFEDIMEEYGMESVEELIHKLEQLYAYKADKKEWKTA